MFTEIFKKLKNSSILLSDLLRKRLEVAITKKLGVINLPYHFWSSDKKINPLTEHLLWAAVLLEDQEKINLIEGIILVETTETMQAKGNKTPSKKELYLIVENIVCSYANHLVEYSQDHEVKKTISDKIQKSLPRERYLKYYDIDENSVFRMKVI